MASITIRNLDERVKRDLRKQAADHGRSLEAEAREILKSGVHTKGVRPGEAETGADLFRRIHERFKALGGVELELPERRPSRPGRIPDFARDWAEEDDHPRHKRPVRTNKAASR
jgi:antitoxin FitA